MLVFRYKNIDAEYIPASAGYTIRQLRNNADSILSQNKFNFHLRSSKLSHTKRTRKTMDRVRENYEKDKAKLGIWKLRWQLWDVRFYCYYFSSTLLHFLVFSEMKGHQGKCSGGEFWEIESKRGAHRAMENVDSMHERGRGWGNEGVARESEGFEGPVCQSKNLREARRSSSHQSHSLYRTETSLFCTNGTHRPTRAEGLTPPPQFEAYAPPTQCRFAV